jgi:hypothetical protein
VTPEPPSHTALVRRARRIDRELAVLYPDAHCELDFSSPLELLVATILSAQTTDKRVNLVTPVLFSRYATAADYAAADRDELEKIIQSTGFYHAKANSLIGLGQALCERFGGEVPPRLRDLVTLPGVGRKTANVVEVWLDHEHRTREGRSRGGHAHSAAGLDDPVAPADLARPANLPFAQARLRCVRPGPPLPLLR